MIEEDKEATAQLADYREQFEAIRQDAQKLVDGLTDAQLNWRTEPGSWSIAECLEHLNTTSRQMIGRIDEAMRSAPPAKSANTKQARHGLIGNWFIRTLEPPVKRKFKAPKVFLPETQHSPEQIIQEFMAIQDQFTERIGKANNFDLSRIKITSLATRLLKLNLGAWFAALAAHERRHLWQAREVKKHADFPRV